MASADALGIVMRLSEEGGLLEVLQDDFHFLKAHLGHNIREVIHSASKQKWAAFLRELAKQGAALNWQIDLDAKESCVSLFFAGGRKDSEFLVIASRSTQHTAALYHELLSINNEQANAIRSLLKEQSLTNIGKEPLDEKLYEELSHLNNELATTQRELTKTNQKLEELNALKNQFLGIASHDLRNPLAVLLSYSEFLIEEASPKLNEEERKFLEVIHSSSQYMLGLVNDLLDVSKIESGTLELNKSPVDLLQLLQDTVKLNRIIAAPKGIAIIFEHEAALPVVSLDQEKMIQVLNNLIGNAVKFSPRGSTIEVRVLLQDKDKVAVSVRDHGPGISEADQERIFKPFMTAKNRGTAGEKTTGLGLAIAKKIVEGHGGVISLHSTMGEGSTFTVVLDISNN